ncbi:ABC transporter ATP-binding protein [Microbacterium sp. H1-D42]|uniref:ABC transporter ATP-binding protein n=1 Tax=Microbacterium sp. H1-D42 TaxID=2925844 RepID=UPI001F53ABAD|nr:ABC transporter ATP-binding protein [Microbacterium sp. H1-D42]UNK72224.1 ABC transporter ATP-binding protein [Microbacterium sp. H1-D42]
MADGTIVCEGLVRIFTAQGVEVQALQGLDLRMATGEMVALVGASGSGKSTLLGILAGLDQPTAGSARVAGHDLVTMKGAERLEYRRHSVGFIWQQSARNLLPYLSASENIAMVHEVAGVVPRAERSTVSAELLGVLGVAEVADRRPAAMSGGQRQRVAIAVALANRPRVLLADEPTGELDELTSAEVLAAMETVNRERGVTTLIVTHDAGVTEHVERTVRIRDGRTSTETLRRAGTDHEGRAVRTAQEYAVLDRAGRMQLPADFVSALELRERVQLSLEPDHVRVAPGQTRRAQPGAGAEPERERAGASDADAPRTPPDDPADSTEVAP